MNFDALIPKDKKSEKTLLSTFFFNIKNRLTVNISITSDVVKFNRTFFTSIIIDTLFGVQFLLCHIILKNHEYPLLAFVVDDFD